MACVWRKREGTFVVAENSTKTIRVCFPRTLETVSFVIIVHFLPLSLSPEKSDFPTWKTAGALVRVLGPGEVAKAAFVAPGGLSPGRRVVRGSVHLPDGAESGYR